MAADTENLRIRLEPALFDRFDRFSKRKAIPKQAAVVRLLTWFLDQEYLLQTILVDELDEQDQQELAGLLCRRLGGDEVTFEELVAHIDEKKATATTSGKARERSGAPKSR